MEVEICDLDELTGSTRLGTAPAPASAPALSLSQQQTTSIRF